MIVPLTPLRFKKRALDLYARKLAVICGEFRFTYREFFARCDRLSHSLRQLGIAKGDRVAFLSYNCHRLLEAYYGVVQMGGILLPLNIRLSREDLTWILNDAEARVLYFDSDFRDVVGDIRRNLRTVEHMIPLDLPTSVPWDSRSSYDDLLVDAGPEPFQEVVPDENDVAELFYTSGTTANPKGVMLTHRNLYLHALSCIIGIGTRDTDIQLHTIPLFHVNGWGTPQSLTCMGGTHVMLKRFEPPEVLRLLEMEKVTLMSLVPTMANALLHCPEVAQRNYSHLRLISLGGAASSVTLIRRMEEVFGCSCYSGYGLTETSPLLSIATLKGSLGRLGDDERRRRQAMTGWPQVGVELRVVTEEGKDVKPDGQEIGEIIARSDSVMEGYWRQPEETERIIRDGWFHTGDMATIDEEGYLLIVDRKKDVIISGGENIASIEIEKCLYGHPAVYEAAVIAVPDPKWGEVPKAIVVLKEGERATEQDILDYCGQHLAAFKCPRSVDFVESLPKGGTGKILKKTLREKYWSGETKRVRG
jgi:fatty-acyl-CoA synthase